MHYVNNSWVIFFRGGSQFVCRVVSAFARCLDCVLAVLLCAAEGSVLGAGCLVRSASVCLCACFVWE